MCIGATIMLSERVWRIEPNFRRMLLVMASKSWWIWKLFTWTTWIFVPVLLLYHWKLNEPRHRIERNFRCTLSVKAHALIELGNIPPVASSEITILLQFSLFYYQKPYKFIHRNDTNFIYMFLAMTRMSSLNLEISRQNVCYNSDFW